MWRELQDEHLLNRARERVRVRLRQQRSVENTNLSSTNMSESRGSENQGSLGDASESENEFGPWSHEWQGSQNERGDNNAYSRKQSPNLGEVERERVRQIVRGSRGEWLGETEREKVRIVREWVQMASQHRGGREGWREDHAAGADAQGDRARDE
ncbi:hypothetical protein JCGZ_01735 [Jatropha curcas]|uniref:Uncharacterized protein n=1 Tax=Jatropha curcas TaxID=180498 RepID=A0A067JJH2_JATCU|nr:hypothetical protein JCGZ_01735 [Jatropha curcas]